MKLNTLFVSALITSVLTVAPLTSLANCSTHKTQQAGNETSAGGFGIAGSEGTGIEASVLAGNETSVGGTKLAGGNETSVGGTKLAGNETPLIEIKLDN